MDSGDLNFCQVSVKRELAPNSEFLITTITCQGSEKAWDELDRMLGAWTRQKQSGQEMTEEESLDNLWSRSG